MYDVLLLCLLACSSIYVYVNPCNSDGGGGQVAGHQSSRQRCMVMAIIIGCVAE